MIGPARRSFYSRQRISGYGISSLPGLTLPAVIEPAERQPLSWCNGGFVTCTLRTFGDSTLGEKQKPRERQI
jgi:hypothetical protein